MCCRPDFDHDELEFVQILELAIDHGDFDNAARLLTDGTSVRKTELPLPEPDRTHLAAALATKGLVILDDGGPSWLFCIPEEEAA